ncbi:hypothetical protein GCM10027416_32470 [Okibacterium endophyticum]
MSDVQVFYAALNGASSALQTATTNLLTEAANVIGEDTGIENPGQRVSLRLEMHRRMTALHDAAYNRIETASALSSTITAIADRYSDLDLELTGQEQP